MTAAYASLQKAAPSSEISKVGPVIEALKRLSRVLLIYAEVP